ncbi:13222_t:CDS:1, partial [Entrophospora sp. SA101]
SELEYQKESAYECELAIEKRILEFKVERHRHHHQTNDQYQKLIYILMRH